MPEKKNLNKHKSNSSDSLEADSNLFAEHLVAGLRIAGQTVVKNLHEKKLECNHCIELRSFVGI